MFSVPPCEMLFSVFSAPSGYSRSPLDSTTVRGARSVQLTVLAKLRKVWKWASTPRKATKLDLVVVSLALASAYYFVVARPARQRHEIAWRLAHPPPNLSNFGRLR